MYIHVVTVSGDLEIKIGFRLNHFGCQSDFQRVIMTEPFLVWANVFLNSEKWVTHVEITNSDWFKRMDEYFTTLLLRDKIQVLPSSDPRRLFWPKPNPKPNQNTTILMREYHEKYTQEN